MAFPPSNRQIEPSDVPGLREPEGLLAPLNAFIVAVAGALDRGLTTRNVAGEVRTVDVVAPTEAAFTAHSPPAWPKPVDVELGQGRRFPGAVQEVRVVKVTRADGVLPGPVDVTGWLDVQPGRDGKRLLRFPRMNGLAPGVRYRLTLLILAE
jgi:hypothetical protein